MTSGAGTRAAVQQAAHAANGDQQIQVCLARHAAGVDCRSELERLRQAHPQRFHALWEEARSGVKGTARERLSALAPSVRGDAAPPAPRELRHPASVTEAQAWLQDGVRESVESVLAWAVLQPAPVRAALAADLRRHALTLRERAIPAILRSGETQAVKGLLEFLAGWEKALPLSEALPLTRHPDAEVRRRVFGILHYILPAGEAAPEILRALSEECAAVKRAACVAAARSRLEAALPRVAALLHSGDHGLVEAAARALTEMGPPGLEALRTELARAWRPQAAAAALEALEALRTSRYGYGRL